MYNARLFYWDPDLLVDGGINCPDCHHKLERHGYTRPRRVVDLHDCFYLVGSRYKCTKCTNAKSGKKTVSFNSWDAEIMQSFPPALQDEFPAYLSHRGAMSKSVFELMRTCFQYGLGSKQFSNSLQVLHRLHYDKMHAQYLDGVLAWIKSNPDSPDQIFSEFSSFDDPKGYGGFVPSSAWLRTMYDLYIELHRAAMDQQAAQKDLELGAMDHSFKTTKQIMKVNGEAVFAATLTVTNQHGEVRVMAFVATTSHEEFKSALLKAKENLKLYGLAQPKVIFTDNPAADRPFLEQIFPSLTEDVIPVEKYLGMKQFLKLSDVNIRTSSSAENIGDDIAKIFSDLNTNDETAKLVVGFDAEWNVDLTARGAPHPTAIIQVAYNKSVYIFQIGHFKGQLPAPLLAFLATGQIIKAGRNVKQDLARLAKEAGVEAFSGGVDLARLAKDLGVISDARMGLPDLCARVLGEKLEKPNHIQISQEWDNVDLSAEQVEYAALDALASLAIYTRLVKTQPAGKISETTLPGTPVSVHNTDGHPIARGIISKNTSPLAGSSPVTKTRIRITISEVLVPAALVSLHNKQPLMSFGPAPFDIVCTRSNIWTRVDDSPDGMTGNPSIHIGGALSDPIIDPELLQFLTENAEDTIDTATNWMNEVDGQTPSETELGVLNGDVDQTALKAALDLNDPEFSTWSAEIRSRVIMDVWHAMARVRVSKEHGFRLSFGIALRDAILIPVPEDKERIDKYLRTKNSSWDKELQFNARWLWKRCRRVVPPPKQLYDAVSRVYQLYGPQKDAKTKLPLFNAQAWHDAKNVLKAIHLGLLSDPPGVPLYFQMGIDKRHGNLPILRCGRGTNNPEGAVHHSLRDRMPKSGVGIRHAASRVTDYVFIHNLVVGTLNRSGKMYKGHYNVEVLNRLQLLLEKARHCVPNAPILMGWVNGDLYIQGNEAVGILPLPESSRNIGEILSYHEPTDSKFKHAYLAKQQGTKYAVITVHSVEEKLCFSELMKTLPAFNRPNNQPPDWKQGSRAWNRKADGETIFYKLPEHLRSYHSKWLRAANAKSSISLSLPQVKALERLNRSDER
ncbi:hypothetical protein B0H17DRAFT_952109, partial [Mycena rosella]